MSTTTLRRPYQWRVVDIVVAAVIAILGGFIFWAWSQGANALGVLWAAFPPVGGLYAGGWFIPAVLGPLIIRKPGAAIFCEVVAASGELLAGSQYGGTVLLSGLLQGIGAEIVFAAFRYRSWNLPVALLAGLGAGIFCGLNDTFGPYGYYVTWALDQKAWYILFCAISGAVISGLLSWLATRALAKTGALGNLASRNAAKERAF